MQCSPYTSSFMNAMQPKEGGMLHKLQKAILALTQFAFPVISGVGFYNGSGREMPPPPWPIYCSVLRPSLKPLPLPNCSVLGPLPKPLPLYTVVGSPIKVEKFQGLPSSPEFRSECVNV